MVPCGICNRGMSNRHSERGEEGLERLSGKAQNGTYDVEVANVSQDKSGSCFPAVIFGTTATPQLFFLLCFPCVNVRLFSCLFLFDSSSMQSLCGLVLGQ